MLKMKYVNKCCNTNILNYIAQNVTAVISPLNAYGTIKTTLTRIMRSCRRCDTFLVHNLDRHSRLSGSDPNDMDQSMKLILTQSILHIQ